MSNSIQSIGLSTTDISNVQAPATGEVAASQIKQSSANTNYAAVQDRTSLSGLGQFLGTVTRIASSLSSFRADAVARVKSQIASGSYAPNPSSVAQKILRAINGAGG